MARPNIRHVYHRKLERVRYSKNLLTWLAAQATRLSASISIIWQLLIVGKSPEQIESLSGSAPANTVAPSISGTTTSGSTLTATNGTWTGTPAPTFTYQWKQNGVNISGATANTYVLTASDVGKTITVSVTATNTIGSVIATSASVGPIT